MTKEETDKKNMDISKHEEEMVEMKQLHDKYETELKPLNDEFKRIKKIENQLSTIVASKTKAETEYVYFIDFIMKLIVNTNSILYIFFYNNRLNNEKQNAEKVTSKIKKIFTGDESMLEDEIQRFNDEHSIKNTQLARTENDLRKAEQSLDKITKQYEEDDRKYHKLIQERSREQDLYEERAEHMQKLCTDLSINPSFDIANCNERATALIPEIQSKLTTERDSVNEMENNFHMVDSEQEKEIQKHREEEVRLTSEISSFNSQMTKIENDLKTLAASIVSVESKKKELTEVQMALKKLADTKITLLNGCNENALRKEIEDNKTNRNKFMQDADELDEQIQSMDAISSFMHDISSKEKHIENKESEIRRYKNKHGDRLQRLFPNENIESDFKKRIDALGKQIQNEIIQLEKESRTCERERGELQMNHRNKKQELTRTENEIRRLEEDIDRICDTLPFADVLASTKELAAKCQMEHGSLKSSEIFYKR